MIKIQKPGFYLVLILGLYFTSACSMPSLAGGTFQSAALVQTSASSSSALKELTQILLNNNGQAFCVQYPQFLAVPLGNEAAERAAEIILGAKRLLMTMNEKRWSLTPNNSLDARYKIPGQYAHFYMSFYQDLLDITSQNILGRADLDVASDLPIKIAVIEQAIHGLEETLKAKPNGSKPGTLYGWWSSSSGFNDYSSIKKERIDKLRSDLWWRYKELMTEYNKLNPNTPLGTAALQLIGNPAVPSTYAPTQAPTLQPTYAPTGYAPTQYGASTMAAAPTQITQILTQLADMDTRANPSQTLSFQNECQKLLTLTQDPQLQALVNYWRQANYPALNPDPQAIIAQSTSGYSPLATGYYQAAMAALQQAASQYPSYGFLIVRRGSQLLLQTLTQQQAVQSQDYQSINTALQSGLSGKISLPNGPYNRSVLNVTPQPYPTTFGANPVRVGDVYYTN